MEVVTAALFLTGAALVLVRYLKRRNWLDLFLLASIPILLLPSILSLAFPSENPALNRTAGALAPAFVLAAMALDGFVTLLTPRHGRPILASATLAVLLWASVAGNFDLVFRSSTKTSATAPGTPQKWVP